MIPLVAIVGRPNVGKSTLFNRLLRKRRAIVQDDPGVTRDRCYGTAHFEGRTFNLVDTGGLEPDAVTGIEALVREQTQFAIEEAQLVLLVLDARDGLTEADRAVVEALRRSGKKTLFVVNKVDGPQQEILANEFYQTGAGELLTVSAEHGLGLEPLIDAILAEVPAQPTEDEAGKEGAPLRVALVGRPNAGKSSLLNCLVGEERAIVDAVPGTTRDPVDVEIETPQGPVIVVDTAGIRRRRSISIAMERFAVVRALDSISNADVACLMMDPVAGVAEQDAKVAGLALDAGKGLILVFSKTDLIAPGPGARRKLEEQIKDKLQFVSYAPILYLSSKTGAGVKRLLPTARRLYGEGGKRIATAELNRFLEEAVASHVPPADRGHPVRFYYMVQPQAHPPTFLITTNNARGVHITYRRYLVNKIRERYGFEGTPIRLFLRQRQRGKDKD